MQLQSYGTNSFGALWRGRYQLGSKELGWCTDSLPSNSLIGLHVLDPADVHQTLLPLQFLQISQIRFAQLIARMFMLIIVSHPGSLPRGVSSLVPSAHVI